MYIMKYRTKAGWWVKFKKLIWRKRGELPYGCQFQDAGCLGFWMDGANKREMRKWLLKYYPDRSWNMIKTAGRYFVFSWEPWEKDDEETGTN